MENFLLMKDWINSQYLFFMYVAHVGCHTALDMGSF